MIKQSWNLAVLRECRSLYSSKTKLPCLPLVFQDRCLLFLSFCNYRSLAPSPLLLKKKIFVSLRSHRKAFSYLLVAAPLRLLVTPFHSLKNVLPAVYAFFTLKPAVIIHSNFNIHMAKNSLWVLWPGLITSTPHQPEPSPQKLHKLQNQKSRHPTPSTKPSLLSSSSNTHIRTIMISGPLMVLQPPSPFPPLSSMIRLIPSALLHGSPLTAPSSSFPCHSIVFPVTSPHSIETSHLPSPFLHPSCLTFLERIKNLTSCFH